MKSETTERWLWLCFPALAMMLGWGLRGYIGGGPLGAMIPGAMTALALALLLRLDAAGAALLAAFGAVGVGFGGQMTYGQTVGLAKMPETFWWAILGFFVKGAVWGLLGGAVMAAAIEFRRAGWRDRFVWAGLALMTAATWAGWKLINEPKLVYFSNRLDRPRPEIWAGLALGALALLVWLGRGEARRTLWSYALWGAAGGGAGFAIGAWIQVAGASRWPRSGIDWWKMMEFAFGLLLGLGYGIAAWLNRREAADARAGEQQSQPYWQAAALAMAAIAVGVGMEYHFESRFNYTIGGAILLAAAVRWRQLAPHVAVTLTFFAFAVDLLESRPAYGMAGWAVVIALTLAVAWLAGRWRCPKRLFLLITLTAVVDSLLKSYLPPLTGAPSLSTQAIFLLSAVGCVWMAGKVRASPENLSKA
ncbi:MAG: hypothetical protein C0504_19585 [Candidatus Solibacter sp.]|nr:hypothetical protein [Candidatus Solibacter sp.]